MQALHTVLERNPEEAAVPNEVDHMAAAVAAPIVVVHKAVEVVQVARMAAVVVDSDLAAAVGLDHKTWIIPPVRFVVITERRIPWANLNIFSQSYFASSMVHRTDYSRNWW
jgi:hypothetical protein